MYKSNIIAHAWVYSMTILAKQRAFMGKTDMIHDRPGETVPEQFCVLYVIVVFTITRQ